MRKFNLKHGLFAGLSALMAGTASFAQDVDEAYQKLAQDLPRIGKPVEGGVWFPPSVGDQAHVSQHLNVALIWLSTIIVAFVCILLLVVIIRFRDTGKEPRRFSHNTPLEIAWTLVPVLILVVLAVFSVPALRNQVTIPEADIVIKATGHQWNWEYDYPNEQINFSAYKLEKDQLEAFGYTPDEYLLAVDNAIFVPVNKTVVVQTTSTDVIHAWKIPSFYVMADATPGRTNMQWFKADQEGIYFGQCSELCGKDHAYMPIVVKVVSQEVYDEWVKANQEVNSTASLPKSIDVASAK